LPVGLEQKWRRHGDAFAVDPDGVLGRSSRNRGLRAVAACHADGVSAVAYGGLGQCGEVVAGFEDDRLDASSRALRDQVEARGLSAARARVDDELGMIRR